MKLTNKLREETLHKAADKFVEKDVQALRKQALELGTEIYQKYLETSRKKIIEVVDAGIVPKNWLWWSESVKIKTTEKEFRDILCDVHNVSYTSAIPKYKEVDRAYSRVLGSSDVLPCPNHPDTLYGNEKVTVADSTCVKKLEQFAKDIAKLNNELFTFCEQVDAVLQTATTYKQLEELAPELAKLCPSPSPKSSGQLIPVETLNAVNAKLAQLGTAGLV
jgi:nucleotide-binding universal stress UspA family protein